MTQATKARPVAETMPRMHSVTPHPMPASAPTRQRKRRRNWFLPASFLLAMVLPGLAAAWFWIHYAADRYVAEAGFSVRSLEGGGGLDIFGSLTGMPGGGASTLSDSYIVLEFLESRALIDTLQDRIDLRAKYDTAKADPVFRLPPDATVETLVEYWRDRMHAEYDSTTGIIGFRIEAFRAEDALEIASHVLDEVEILVNQLSEAARNDSLQNAKGEVARAEERLRRASIALRDFRESNKEIDPAATAMSQAERIGELESDLSRKKIELDRIGEQLGADAVLRRRINQEISSLEARIAAEKQERGDNTHGPALTGLLAEYENLRLEQEFAQQAYTSALASLEQARAQADSRQRYLAVFSAPAIPEDAVHPRRLTNAALSVLFIFVGWGVVMLLGYATRDHMT